MAVLLATWWLTASSQANNKTHLTHDDLPWVCGLHDRGLHKVALGVVTVTSSDDLQAGGRLGMVQPLLDPSKRLQTGWNTVNQKVFASGE